MYVYLQQPSALFILSTMYLQTYITYIIQTLWCLLRLPTILPLFVFGVISMVLVYAIYSSVYYYTKICSTRSYITHIP